MILFFPRVVVTYKKEKLVLCSEDKIKEGNENGSRIDLIIYNKKLQHLVGNKNIGLGHAHGCIVYSVHQNYDIEPNYLQKL